MDTNTLSEMLLGEHASQYMQSILLVIGGFIVLSIVNILLKRRIRKIEDKTLHEGSAGIKRSLPVMRFFQRIAIPMSSSGSCTSQYGLSSSHERIQATVQAAVHDR